MVCKNRIRKLAHELWEIAGKPEGQDDHFWFQAENMLKKDEQCSKNKECKKGCGKEKRFNPFTWVFGG